MHRTLARTEIVRVPKGASSIMVAEMFKKMNILAVKTVKEKKYCLNEKT